MNSSDNGEETRRDGLSLLPGIAMELQRLAGDLDDFQHHFCDMFMAFGATAVEDGQQLDEMSQRAAALSQALSTLSMHPDAAVQDVLGGVRLGRLARRLAGDGEHNGSEEGEVDLF